MCILCNFQILTTITPALHIIGGKIGGVADTHGDNYGHYMLTLIQWQCRNNLTSLCFCLNTSLGNGQTTDMIYFLNINAVDVEFIKITINIIRFGFKISKKGLVMRVLVVYFLDTFVIRELRD